MTSQLFSIKAIKITQRMTNMETLSRSKSPQKEYKISVSLSVNIHFSFDRFSAKMANSKALVVLITFLFCVSVTGMVS